ncbi:DUF2946 family protein [Saccharospirillum sp. HFRX-1]|uniref:hypothetical protein n=1 Tax=unclassified Saccharospirillum TaxID=2633430 RepID=UPI003719C3F6
MSDFRQTANFFGPRRTDAACLMVKIAQRRWRALLLVTLAMLVCQGALQHGHEPVHLAQQMQSVSAHHDHHSDIDDLTDCQSCNLLKLSQVGALSFVAFSTVTSAAPLVTQRPLWTLNKTAIQPAARGPPASSSILN